MHVRHHSHPSQGWPTSKRVLEYPHDIHQWGRSSVGRASRSQCEGREFDPPRLHQLSIGKSLAYAVTSIPGLAINLEFITPS